MTTKKTANSETRKNTTPTSSTASNPSIGDSITVQDPPGSAKDAKTPPTSTIEGKKNFHPNTTTDSPSTNRLKEAEQLIFQGLKQLQEIYNTASKTNANKITIERTTFEKIATSFQRAYEHII